MVVVVAPIVYEALLLLQVFSLWRGKKMQQQQQQRGKRRTREDGSAVAFCGGRAPTCGVCFLPIEKVKKKKHNHKVPLGRLNGRAINHDQRWEPVRLFFFYLNSEVLVFFSFPLETFPAMDLLLLHWQSVAHTQRSLNAKCFPKSLPLLSFACGPFSYST